MQRRQFLKMSALGALVGGQSGLYASNESKIYHQPAIDIPIVDKSEVVVCGGGPAGVAAAISAARQGATVQLIEVHGFLGGVWTAGMVNNILDYQNKSGLIHEILQNLEKTKTQNKANVFDIEAIKYVLEQMCVAEKIKLLYHSRVVSVSKDEKNRLSHVIVENKSGRQAFAGNIFIDATGEGDVAAQAGCGFDLGHPVSGKTQPMSMIALLGGLEYYELNSLNVVRGNGVNEGVAKTTFLSELNRAGVSPSYTRPTLFTIRNDHFAMMANHEYGFSGIDAIGLTNATIQARAEIHKMINALRNLGGAWTNIQLLATSPQIGVREGRRIHGRYMLTKEDLIMGAEFKDAVCRATFNVDVHALEKSHGGGYGHSGVEAKPYDIPMRSLIAKDVDGLLLAGRCISGDFFAHASYRVTGNSVPLGEEAGKLAAISSHEEKLPHQIKYPFN